jgi:hypothetical protein
MIGLTITQFEAESQWLGEVESKLVRSEKRISSINIEYPTLNIGYWIFSGPSYTPIATPKRNVTRFASLLMGTNVIDPSALSKILPSRR